MYAQQEVLPNEQPPSSFHHHRHRPRSPNGVVAWWFRLTAPPGALTYSDAPTHQERERLRRAGLASIVAPMLSLSTLLLVQQASDPGTLVALVLCVTCPLLALVLFNRRGQQRLAALLIVGCMEVSIEVALLTTLHDGLSAAWLPTFDLFMLPLIAVGVLLSRRSVLFAALLHIGLILGDFFLLPHAPDLTVMIAVWHGPLVCLARPILIQTIGGTMSFVQVRSTDEAIARADRAEELAALQQKIVVQQRRVAEEKRQLEDTAIRLRDAMALIAGGHEQVKIPIVQGSVLWEVGRGVSLLMQRLKRAGVHEQELHRTHEQTHALQIAMERCARGEPTPWPKPSGTAVDPLIELGRRFALRAWEAERGRLYEEKR